MAYDTDHLTRGDLSNVLQELRRHIATRHDLVELATALDDQRVTCPPFGWRFTIIRNDAGQIAEVVAVPFELPAQ